MQKQKQHSGWPRRTRQRGFTLIEASLVTVIVGVGVLAIVAAQQAYHKQNAYSQRVGTALLLANEIRELTMHLPQHDSITNTQYWGPEPNEPDVDQFDDLDDFDGSAGSGVTFSPPIDALRQAIPNMAGWSQVVTVENVLPTYINASVTAPDNSTDLMRFTVRVLYQGPNDEQPGEVTRLTWIDSGD